MNNLLGSRLIDVPTYIKAKKERPYAFFMILFDKSAF